MGARFSRWVHDRQRRQTEKSSATLASKFRSSKSLTQTVSVSRRSRPPFFFRWGKRENKQNQEETKVEIFESNVERKGGDKEVEEKRESHRASNILHPTNDSSTALSFISISASPAVDKVAAPSKAAASPSASTAAVYAADTEASKLLSFSESVKGDLDDALENWSPQLRQTALNETSKQERDFLTSYFSTEKVRKRRKEKKGKKK